MAGTVVNTEKPVELLRHAYQVYLSKRVRGNLIFPALRLLAAYLREGGSCREPEALYAAALYLVFRHPNTYPNPIPRSYFSMQSRHYTKRKPAESLFDGPFDVKNTSIDWYAKRIIERVGIIVLYDDRRLPYFLEREGPIYQLVMTLAAEAAMNAALSFAIKGERKLLEAIILELLDRIFGVLQLLPEVFRQSLYDHLASHVGSLVSDSMRILGI